MAVEIVQIRKRADQGQTRPFLSRGDDGHWYYVKGVGAGRRSQICELVAGTLARSFGLPIAPFEVVQVPPELIQPTVDLDLSELGAGPAFGSRSLPFCQELSVAHLELVPDQVRRDVLAFDWWIRNADRSLTELGGNPNLLWDGESDSLVVIDHNVAFESAFDQSLFLETHVFRDDINDVFGDWQARQSYRARFERSLAVFDQSCEQVPDEWWWFAEDVPSDFDREMIRRSLARCSEEGFWDTES